MWQFLKQARIKKNLTQEDIANKVGISKQYYSQIEAGKRGLSYQLAVLIASELGTTPDKIFLPDMLAKCEQDSVTNKAC